VGIDEPGCERQALGVDFAVCDRSAEVADRCDAVAGDADVGVEAGVARAVEDRGLAVDQSAAQRQGLVLWEGLGGCGVDGKPVQRAAP